MRNSHAMLFHAGIATLLLLAGAPLCPQSQAAKLAGLHVVDQEHLMLHVLDGEVSHKDDGLGPTAFLTARSLDQSEAVQYTPHLNAEAAQSPQSWTIASGDDPAYSGGLPPTVCYRKSKVNGHAEKHWVDNDFHYDYTFEHFVFLRLPRPMRQGKSYTVDITPELNLERSSTTVIFDIFRTRSEALHINLVGYHPGTMANADLYIWMGDGGPRDYRAYEGNAVYLYDVRAGTHQQVGKVAFWHKSATDVFYYNLTRSDVWNVDAIMAQRPGTYRLAVEGVGCTPDFLVSNRIYEQPFRVAVKGYYYMRIGEPVRDDIRPVPRQPRYIPRKDPADTVVYLTTMHPWHERWRSFTSGDVWDKPNDWKQFRKLGNPTNSNAWGGHSDALDWDRHLAHVSNIYDMLLPYILTGGALDADDIGIAESGNGIPDLLDEARNEVDFWLRLRDGEGYAHGLTCPNESNEFYQAAPTALAAWANAANAAMLADAYRVAGQPDLMAVYRDHALEAFAYADGLADPMLDKHQELGNTAMKGRDFKMTAAAYLYNVTGDPAFERLVVDLSVCTSGTAVLDNAGIVGTSNQLWATAGYLKTPRKASAPELQATMRAALLHQAYELEAGQVLQRPSRRATNRHKGYMRTGQNVNHAIIAHAVAEAGDEKNFLLKALLLEAGYGLGRNPLNMVQMTTGTTPLSALRSVQGAYTSGRNDGSPGMHPGHTPYMNLDDWDPGMTMGSPSKLHGKCYPTDFKETWPIGEGYFNTRYVWAHNEFTPRQTMRGKMALYAYLHGLDRLGRLGR